MLARTDKQRVARILQRMSDRKGAWLLEVRAELLALEASRDDAVRAAAASMREALRAWVRSARAA